VNIHAIGDRANRAAVDSFENVLAHDCQGCNEVRRLRIEHAQIIASFSSIVIVALGLTYFSIQMTRKESQRWE
jgi:predicted amidohydrolase YtcJ